MFLQWLSNIEGDNDFQMCGGCGKRFERKAALHSHAQMCTKRIAVCNTIKENNAKKKEEEVCKDSKNKTAKVEKTEVLKGSSKRKPYLLRTYKTGEVGSPDDNKVPLSKENNDICDVNANCEVVETNCDNNKEVAEVVYTVKNSQSTPEDLQSPSKKDFVSSPSIEKIDTKKMLNIIGITTDYENGKDKNKCNSKCSTDDGTSNSEHHSEDNSRSHTASDFDLFCQSVAESLLTDPLECAAGEIDESPQKTPKTVPLILRRKNKSCKAEKKNSILGHTNHFFLRSHSPKENRTDNEKKDSTQNKNTAQANDLGELDSSPSNTNFKITVKSLEDLIGVSPQDHKKKERENSENKEINHVHIGKNELDIPNSVNLSEPVSFEVSDTLRANVSLEKLHKKYPKCLKRKRTSSLDFTEYNKFSKTSTANLSSNKQDISFISKASPFMDQKKHLCIPCQTTYPTLSKLLWHMSAHFSWFRFQCSRCSFISFNKLDCANHARKVHCVKKSSIQSVVLPIPNWKTVLMSHDFYMLNDENDLSGKHTDEILSGNPEEITIIDNLNENIKNDECDESEWTNRLFVESKNVDYEPENDPLGPDTPPDYTNSIKQGNIDVMDDDQESFQIEVPQEIYTLDISDIIEGAHFEERYCCGTRIKIEKIDDEEDTNMSNCISTDQENESLIEDIKIKTEVTSDGETNEKNEEVNNFEDQECFNKHSEQIVNIRPTRNRMRSIKTIQDDFFYDLSKVIKLNDTSVNKSNLQKHKKSVSQKNSKDSNSSSGKNDTQPIKVYAKKI